MKFDLDEILENLRGNQYNYIGSGSGRHVFDLGNGYVVKAAKNRKGYAQNKVEYLISQDSQSHLFAQIMQVSDDNGLLIMEKAIRVKEMKEVWKYFHVHSNSELSRIDEIRNICEKYSLLFADLCRTSSWGWVKDRIVIIDYGFTSSVRRKYYSHF